MRVRTGGTVDVVGPGNVTPERLVEDWERMSGHFLGGRSLLLDDVVTHLAVRLAARPSTVVELGSGPGHLLDRLAAVLPAAELIGVEIDPVLRRLHELRSAGPPQQRIHLVDADLADPAWVRHLRGWETPDVVVAVQVLHYFPAARFASLLGEIRSLLAPGGVFVHVDSVPADAVADVDGVEVPFAADDPWTSWWSDARRCDQLAAANVERDRQLARRPVPSAEYHPDATAFRSLLADAGLSDVVTQRRSGGSQLTIVGV